METRDSQYKPVNKSNDPTKFSITLSFVLRSVKFGTNAKRSKSLVFHAWSRRLLDSQPLNFVSSGPWSGCSLTNSSCIKISSFDGHAGYTVKHCDGPRLKTIITASLNKLEAIPHAPIFGLHAGLSVSVHVHRIDIGCVMFGLYRTVSGVQLVSFLVWNFQDLNTMSSCLSSAINIIHAPSQHGWIFKNMRRIKHTGRH